jgi:transcriptional regulator with XRE-family HTH domain
VPEQLATHSVTFSLSFSTVYNDEVRQLPFLSALGSGLRSTRRSSKLTQSALAQRVGISLPTLRQAECGQGALTTFVNLAAAFDMEIGGRSLPPGETLGARLAALRKRRGLGRRIVAEMAGISPTTLAAVERDSGAHLATVTRVGEALGAPLRLVPKGAPAQFWATAAASSVHDGWTTPPEILGRLYEVVGGAFTLDPCSPVRTGPRAPVRARIRYVAEDDSLNLPWMGAVFMNPPYGRALPRWTAKARTEAETGRASVVFGLIPARTDTRWWHADVAGHADIWLLRGRLAFGDGAQPAPFPSAIVVWAASDDHRTRMGQAFPDAWYVPSAFRLSSNRNDAVLAAAG